ncbi:VCBS repeat-containing protein [Microbacterium sp. X-17]|uniref:FG-GAP repeat domain-containing protein n=1 Tax=Microbacterium sp. X-17 TaxID=3144404 RepID=UPI0031F56F2E
MGARRNRIATLVLAVLLCASTAIGVASPASARTPPPLMGATAATVDCSTLQGAYYSAMQVTTSAQNLQPGGSYTLDVYTSSFLGGPALDNQIPFTADATGAAGIDTNLSGQFVASAYYLLRIMPVGSTIAVAEKSLTSTACDSGVRSVGSPTIGITCSDRYQTPAGVNGTTFEIAAALSGFPAGASYTLAVQNTYQQPTVTATPDGHLSFDAILSNTTATTQPTESWGLWTTSQGTPVASGTLTMTDTCPPLTKSTKRAALTHDGDVTGDGYGDLLAVDVDGRLWLYTNGIRSNPNHLPFSAGRVIGYGWLNNGPIQEVRQGDVTGDGYTDLVGIRSDGALVAYYNNININAGRVPYSASTVIGSGWLPFMRFALADVNGDGYADIIAVKSDGSAYYYQNHFATDPLHRPFTSGVPIAGQPFGQYGSIGGADVNADGYSDILNDGMSINPSRVPAGSPAPYTSPYDAVNLSTIGYDVRDVSGGWSAGDYEGRGSAGTVYAGPGNNGQLIYVKDPGASSTAAVIGSGWQTFAFLIH